MNANFQTMEEISVDDIIISPEHSFDNIPLYPIPLKGLPALRAVFKDYLPVLPSLNLRPVVIKEVKKMINCQNPESGTYYVCPDCNFQKFVPFTCKSRFCPTCGAIINKQRCVAISDRILDVDHRQWTFTIPKSLWPYFKDHWERINILFDAASETIRILTKGICPSLDVEPGFVGILHTFGRSNEFFEPHLHFIVSAGGLTKYGKWFVIKHYSYEKARMTFQHILLKKLSLPSVLGSSFRPVAKELKDKYPKGFVVNLPPPEPRFQNNVKSAVKYIARYVARPCIASGRIDAYDGRNVTYHYSPHDSDETVSSTLPALTFIQYLTQHIPEENFRIIRYYGLYNRSNQEDVDRIKIATEKGTVDFLYSPEDKEYRQYYAHWRGSMIHSFSVDPLCCPECGCNDMLALYAKYNGETYYAPDTRPRYQGPPPQKKSKGKRGGK